MNKFIVGLADLKITRPTEKFDPSQPRDPAGTPTGGQWTATGASGAKDVLFEVAPNPDNQELLDRWNSLTDEEKAKITAEISDEFTPKVLEALGIKGTIQDTVGGFEGQINPSLALSVDERPFEVAGALGDAYSQKAMVVMSAAPAPGLEPVGMISIQGVGGDVATLRGIQDKLGDLAAGWTYRDGNFEILNFTDQSNVELATAIDQKLGGSYLVGHGTIYSAYVEEADYVRPRNDAEGNSWSSTRRSLSRGIEQALEGKLGAVGKGLEAEDLAKFDPNQPRVPRGQSGGGRWTDGSAGGVKVLNSETKRELTDPLEGKSLEELHAMAEENQAQLVELGRAIEDETGSLFVDVGVKNIDTARRKIFRDGYDGPHQITDLARASFVADTPEQGDAIVAALSKKVTVYDKGWVLLPQSGYFDRKMLLVFDNGGVAELQVIPRNIAAIKGGPGAPVVPGLLNGAGHRLYEIAREPSTPLEIAERANALNYRLYTAALKGGPFASLARAAGD